MSQVYSDRLGWARLAVIAAAVVIAAHGLIHLMGVALLWKVGEPGGLRYADAVPATGGAIAEEPGERDRRIEEIRGAASSHAAGRTD